MIINIGMAIWAAASYSAQRNLALQVKSLNAKVEGDLSVIRDCFVDRHEITTQLRDKQLEVDLLRAETQRLQLTAPQDMSEDMKLLDLPAEKLQTFMVLQAMKALLRPE